MLYSISGYWKDDQTEFYGLLVKDTDDFDEMDDDGIFYYGMSEKDILNHIKSGENSGEEFVITSYELCAAD